MPSSFLPVNATNYSLSYLHISKQQANLCKLTPFIYHALATLCTCSIWFSSTQSKIHGLCGRPPSQVNFQP